MKFWKLVVTKQFPNGNFERAPSYCPTDNYGLPSEFEPEAQVEVVLTPVYEDEEEPKVEATLEETDDDISIDEAQRRIAVARMRLAERDVVERELRV